MPTNASHPQHADLPLADMQGDIITPHNRTHAIRMYFLITPAHSANARLWLAQLAAAAPTGPLHLTSAARQQLENQDADQLGIASSLFCAVSLTAAGMHALKIPAADRPTFPNSTPSLEPTFHGALLLADDDPLFVHRTARAAVDRIRVFGNVTHIDHSNASAPAPAQPMPLKEPRARNHQGPTSGVISTHHNQLFYTPSLPFLRNLRPEQPEVS